MWKYLLSFFFPNPNMCVLCEKETAALTVCDDCRAHWQALAAREGQCRRCGHFGTRAAACDTCRDWPAYFRGNTALLPYDGAVREMILRFKFYDEPWRAEGLAPIFRDWTPPAVDGVVPVPLHARRLRERGYNQSALLAKVLCRVHALPLAEPWLSRVRHTPHQTGLPRAQRLTNVQQAFAVPEKTRAEVGGKRVLLVDDVMTTGSTLLACARALHAAGAAEVHSLTVAASLR